MVIYGVTMDIAMFNTQISNENTISGNIRFNPLFVGSDDYHLIESSPCINAGILGKSSLDYEGNIIPHLKTVTDIGIYETDLE